MIQTGLILSVSVIDPKSEIPRLISIAFYVHRSMSQTHSTAHTTNCLKQSKKNRVKFMNLNQYKKKSFVAIHPTHFHSILHLYKDFFFQQRLYMP